MGRTVEGWLGWLGELSVGSAERSLERQHSGGSEQQVACPTQLTQGSLWSIQYICRAAAIGSVGWQRERRPDCSPTASRPSSGNVSCPNGSQRHHCSKAILPQTVAECRRTLCGVSVGFERSEPSAGCQRPVESRLHGRDRLNGRRRSELDVCRCSMLVACYFLPCASLCPPFAVCSHPRCRVLGLPVASTPFFRPARRFPSLRSLTHRSDAASHSIEPTRPTQTQLHSPLLPLSHPSP